MLINFEKSKKIIKCRMKKISNEVNQYFIKDKIEYIFISNLSKYSSCDDVPDW